MCTTWLAKAVCRGLATDVATGLRARAGRWARASMSTGLDADRALLQYCGGAPGGN